MFKRLLPVIIGALGFCLPAAADTSPALELNRQDLFSEVESATLVQSLPVLTPLDGRRFSAWSELGRMGMTPFDVFPVAPLDAVEVRKARVSARYGSERPVGVADLRVNRLQTSGEVGFSYGKSTGKYGHEEMQAYIIGTVGNDKFQITAGAAYGESSGRFPRFGR